MNPLGPPPECLTGAGYRFLKERLVAQRSEVPCGSLGKSFGRLHCVAAPGHLFRSGELQAPGAPQVDPVAAGPSHDAHQDLLAARAADDHAWSAQVHVDPADRVDGATARARGLGCGHLQREDLAQQAANRVSVHLRFSCFHRHPPVAPNLSVLIRSGSYPSSTSNPAADSTNEVGPQMNAVGPCSLGHATSRTMSRSILLA